MGHHFRVINFVQTRALLGQSEVQINTKRLGEALVALAEDELVRLHPAELRKRIVRILG